VARSPLDIYAPYQFLSPSILRCETYTAFRARHAELLPSTHPLVRHMMEKMKAKGRTMNDRSVSIIARDASGKPKYKNLDKLAAQIEPHTFRVLKQDCLDLPPKIFTQRHVHLHDKQEAILAKLKAIVKLGASSEDEARKPILPMSATLYYQQILCGIIPEPLRHLYGDAEHLFDDPTVNPRVAALLDELEEVSSKAIIWCRFTKDVVDITRVLQGIYGEGSAVAFYGSVDNDLRGEIIQRFQDKSSPLRWFVGNPQAGGTGTTLTAAEDVIYYSNSFRFLDRLQSEDRCHRIGTTGAVRYVDLVVPGSVDELILKANEAKMDLADAITGDSLRELFK
jgi:SNF2 family DNA or RNA helicase